MKPKHLLALAAVSAIGGSAYAQELADGTYYIQNVESGLFLCGANSWGTQGSVSAQGEMFSVALKNGAYTLTNTVVTAGNKTFGYNLYVDTNTSQNGDAWTIEPVAGEDGVFTIYGRGKKDNVEDSFDGYLAQSEKTGNHIGFVAGSVTSIDNSAKWRFLTKEEAIEQLKSLEPGYSIPASFLLQNPNFSRSHSQAAWKVSSDCTNKNLGGGDNGNFCAESYHSPFTISQVIEGIPNGEYGVSAQGFVRSDGGDISEAVFFANEETQAFPEKTGTENSMTDASNVFATGAYTIPEIKVIVTNNKLEVGVKNTSKSLWCIWDNFNITFYGQITDLSALKENLASALDEGKKYQGELMNAEVASALDETIKKYSAVSFDTAEAYNAVISEVNGVVNSAKASAEIYASIADKVSTLDKDGQAAFAETETGAKYADKSLVDEDVAADLRVAAKKQTTEGADMTLAIVNPTIEGDYGWKIERSVNGNGPLLSGTSFEYWSYTAGQGGFNYSQVITGLPNGKYTVSADMYNDQVQKEGDEFSAAAGVYAKAGTDIVMSLVDVLGTEFNTYSTTEITVLDGTLTIGIKNADDETNIMPARWFVADNFKLTYVGSLGTAELANSLAEAVATAKTLEDVNMGAKEQKAIADAIKEYDGAKYATEEEYSEAITAVNTAIENANASAKVYKLTQAAIGNGSIPTDVLDGWACTNAQTFHVNTWSTEGASDGSNMLTPFIENWMAAGGKLENGTISFLMNGLTPGDKYVFSALGRAYIEGQVDVTLTGMTMFANDKEVSLTEQGTASTFEGKSTCVYGTFTLVGEVDANGELRIGFKIEDTNCNWLAFKDVKIGTMPTVEITAATGYNTFVAPCNIDLAGTGVKAYVVTEVSDAYVTLKEVEQIASGEAVILNGEVGKHEAGVVEKAAKADDNKLIGSTGVTATGSEYVLTAKDGKAVFAKVQAGVEIPAGKAYFVASSDAKFIAINGEETGIISNFIESLLSKIVAIYSVDGKAQKKLTKGINIIKMSDGTTQKLILE